MTELFISVPLNALQEVRHEGGLLLNHLIFKSLILLLLLLILRQLLKLFKLVRQILEVGRPIVIFCGKVLLLHGPVLSQFLRAVMLARGHFKALSQGMNLCLLLALQSLNGLYGRIFILLHVVIPCCREFLKLLPLYRLNLN